MSDPLVVARFRGTEDNPRFTKPATIEELLDAVVQKLPIDLIYVLVPHPDGKGYSLREAGRITLDILQGEHQTPPAPLEPPAPVEEEEEVVEAAPVPPKVDYSFTSTEEPDAFQFDRPKSQAELLKARGLEQPVELTPPAQPTKEKRAKGKRGAKKAPLKAEDSDDMSDLPNPVSRSSRIVTGIRQATKAEEAAASQFGKLK